MQELAPDIIGQNYNANDMLAPLPELPTCKLPVKFHTLL